VPTRWREILGKIADKTDKSLARGAMVSLGPSSYGANTSPADPSPSRSLDGAPEARIIENRRCTAPPEPSKPSSAGLDGTPPTESPKVEAQQSAAELGRASAVLNRAAVRFVEVEGVTTLGVWSDLDGPGVRAALRTLGLESLSVAYLDGGSIPTRFKLRQVKGEPVPISVLAEMEQHPVDPRRVRDRILQEIGWHVK